MKDQLDLFRHERKTSPPPPLHTPKEVSPDSTILAALWPYSIYLTSEGYTKNTIGAFIRDIHILKSFVGDLSVGKICTQDLRNFVAYLRDRCQEKPKSVYRRVTGIKNFLRWLKMEKIIQEDPSAAFYLTRPVPPLPVILNDEECRWLLLEASKTPRDYLIVLLLLEGGLKRNELLDLEPAHVDIQNTYRPTVLVNAPKRGRSIVLPPDFTPGYKAYVETLRPSDKLFPYTERGISHVIWQTAERAKIKKHVSSQILRDTYVVRKIRAGETIENALKKVGLSTGAMNAETIEKYRKLSAGPV